MENRYLYCIIKQKGSRKFDGIQGQDNETVYTINHGGLAIVVSDTAKKDFPFIRENLTCHQKVIEQVMGKGYDVLPVRFSTVAASSKDIKEKVLKSKRKQLLETFPIIGGRIELGLRAFWKDMSNVFQEIIKESSQIQGVKKQALRNSNQFKVAQVGELVQKALDAKREREAQEILNPLKKLAVDFKKRELLRNRDIMKDSMILSSAFLLIKENERGFDKRIERVIKANEERIKFIYVGPLPPFNFVNLHLEV